MDLREAEEGEGWCREEWGGKGGRRRRVGKERMEERKDGGEKGWGKGGEGKSGEGKSGGAEGGE